MSILYFAQERPMPLLEGRRFAAGRRSRLVYDGTRAPIGDGLIKIGITSNRLRFRLQVIGSAVERSLVLLGAVPDSDLQTESRLHRRFSGLKAETGRNWGREWFRPGADLLDFIFALPRCGAERDLPALPG